jgi:hypothetical protein
MTNALFLSFPSISFCHSERERGIPCMDASLRLRSVQHDKRGVIPSALFLSFRARARNPVRGCFASLSMTSAVSFQVLFFVIPSALFLSFRARARNPVWMLRFAYAPFSMTSAVSFRALFFVIPSAVRNPVHGCFASLSMTSAVSFRALFFVIPSESEESSMDASLRPA